MDLKKFGIEITDATPPKTTDGNKQEVNWIFPDSKLPIEAIFKGMGNYTSPTTKKEFPVYIFDVEDCVFLMSKYIKNIVIPLPFKAEDTISIYNDSETKKLTLLKLN